MACLQRAGGDVNEQLCRRQSAANVEKGWMTCPNHDQIAMRKRLVQRVDNEPSWYP